MIKIENIIEPSPEQMLFIIEGMRNPKNSWNRSDSKIQDYIMETEDMYSYTFNTADFEVGEKDWDLMKRLKTAGPEHRKYMRMMPVGMRITAPLYWWKEFDTYKIGTTSNSCSTMHKIADKEFTSNDFSWEKLTDPTMDNKDICDLIVRRLNEYRELYLETKDKIYWWQMIQLLPSSYNQTRNIMMNYEVLHNMCKQRKGHKLDEWRAFFDVCLSLEYADLIGE